MWLESVKFIVAGFVSRLPPFKFTSAIFFSRAVLCMRPGRWDIGDLTLLSFDYIRQDLLMASDGNWMNSRTIGGALLMQRIHTSIELVRWNTNISPSVWYSATKCRIFETIVTFNRSTCPLGGRWYSVDVTVLTLRSSHKTRKNLDVECSLRSVTTVDCLPKWANHRSMTMLASVLTEGFAFGKVFVCSL